ncbi:hypothetical protein CPT_Moabite_027 [Serratia phage Moabite]|uniref:Uncharacterized protein n=2 Tax=Moabitevirus TaxID=2843422 RepID=A0A4Y5TPV5_9CAUD|nr:hypothetical protein HWB23_gp296 [Serratia phage vB_SmaM_ 2050HW]YP_009849123.1 hypothetical protein HWC48_gp027 [Serratia phage Moabite]UCR74569.1 hypothetical protein [Serratia phage BUCT660]UGO54244.1 hypothetical protein HAYMO_262 [Serratia phage vB_SmaM_Haymo]UQT03750.1 hypothetical protein KODAMA_02830 [Serratia phage vB_SmaM-Kodama]URG14140.1 hypothetical protein [Pectobacterium phage vB_ParM-25]ATA65631.1 hypothetical protein 2050HW_00296 [Serratia phage vB_SmaM_ 2050HW]
MIGQTTVVGNVPLLLRSITKPYPYLVHENTIFQLMLFTWWSVGDLGWAEQLYTWVIRTGKDELPRAAMLLPGRNPVDYDRMLFEIFDNVCNHEDILTDYMISSFDHYRHLYIEEIYFRKREFTLKLAVRK